MQAIDTKAVSAYFDAQVDAKLHELPIPKVHDLAPASQLFQLINSSNEVDALLENAKQEQALQSISIAQRRRELDAKQKNLNGILSKFEGSLKENQGKRIRLSQKMEEEHKLKAAQDLEAIELKQTLQELTVQKNKKLALIAQVAHYRKYLQKVVDTSSEFTEVAEILTRYETLKAANTDLVTKSAQASEDLQKQRSHLKHLVDRGNNEVLAFTNKVGSLNAALELAKQRSSRCQDEVDSYGRSAGAQSLLLGQVKLASGNLHSLIKTSMSGECSDTLQQLDKIGHHINHLMRLIDWVNASMRPPTSKELASLS